MDATTSREYLHFQFNIQYFYFLRSVGWRYHAWNVFIKGNTLASERPHANRLIPASNRRRGIMYFLCFIDETLLNIFSFVNPFNNEKREQNGLSILFVSMLTLQLVLLVNRAVLLKWLPQS